MLLKITRGFPKSFHHNQKVCEYFWYLSGRTRALPPPNLMYIYWSHNRDLKPVNSLFVKCIKIASFFLCNLEWKALLNLHSLHRLVSIGSYNFVQFCLSNIYLYLSFSRKAWWPNRLRARLRIERSEFEPWPRTVPLFIKVYKWFWRIVGATWQWRD